MQTANIFFGLRLNYSVTMYPALMKYALTQPIYSYDTKDYLWVFRINDIASVKAIIAIPFVFDAYDENMFIAHSKPIQEKIHTEPYKGTGFVGVVETPDIFVVTTIINKKEQIFRIAKEAVINLWGILQQYPLNHPTKSKTIAGKWCEKLGITRFHRKTGYFDGDKMYGERMTYFKFYYSIKVLQFYGVVDHTKSGQIIRLKDSWEPQTQLKIN